MKIYFKIIVNICLIIIFGVLVGRNVVYADEPSSLYLRLHNIVMTTATPLTQANFPISLSGAKIQSSSIALGDINNDGIDDIVVGGTDGKIYAYTGNGTKLWEYDTGSMGIEGKAAIGDIDQDGFNEIVIGAGSTFTLNNHGGLYVLDHLGNLRCSFTTGDFNGDGWRDGVYSSPALADIDENDSGKLEIIFGAWDGYVRVLNDDCSPVWQKFVRDTVWSSPAIGDIDKDGHLDIVIGVDTHNEPAFGTTKGGMLHVYDRNSNELSGFPKQIDEVIFSSPALGDINGDGWLEIIVGTGDFWGNPACGHPDGCTPGVGHYVNAWDHNGNTLPGWPRPTGDYVWASPALADLNEDGKLDVIVNVNDSMVHAWDYTGNEITGWPVQPVTPAGPGTTVSMPSNASPIIADISGDGHLEVILPSNWELVVWDKNGQQITRNSFPPASGAWELTTNYTLSDTPAIADIDGDNDLELVAAGASSSDGSQGAIFAWDFTTATTASVSWSTFRYDEINSGTYPTPPSLKVLPESIFVLHSLDDITNPIILLRLQNGGSDTILWEALTDNSAVTVTPQNGAITNATSIVTATIDVSRFLSGTGVAPGTYNLGHITVSGTDGLNPVIGSPAIIPVQLYVGTIYNVYLPMVLK